MALAIWGVPSFQAGYVPPDPRRLEGDVDLREPQLGDALPATVAKWKPRVVAIHVECLSCSEVAYRKVKGLFQDPRVLNVVVATGVHDYKNIENSTPGARVLYTTADQVQSLNPRKGLRVFGVDLHGHLSYIQKNPSADPVREVIHAAKAGE